MALQYGPPGAWQCDLHRRGSLCLTVQVQVRLLCIGAVGGRMRAFDLPQWTLLT